MKNTKIKDTSNENVLYKKKEVKIAGINLFLAAVSVFLFDYWFGMVSKLSAVQMAENFGVVFLAGATLFVGKTFYGKGTANNLKKTLYTTLLAASTVGLMLYTALSLNIVYPLSGAILIFIAFYMLSLSASTMNLVGIISAAMIIATGIGYLKMNEHIDWIMAGTLSKWGIFIILFIGGVWPHVRRSMHGISGVNKDGGGFGSSDDDDSEGGDEGDGDGDTGDE